MKIKFMDLARKLSYKSEMKFKHGSVIVKGGRIISFGFNTNKTHTKSKTKRKTKHAETSAILDAGFTDFSGCDLYVYRESQYGTPAISKPCPGCEELIRQSNIRRVFFSIDVYPYWKEIKCDDL